MFNMFFFLNANFDIARIGLQHRVRMAVLDGQRRFTWQVFERSLPIYEQFDSFK